MAISANTLFHFTKRDSLESILKTKGFFARYSLENFENVLPAKSPFVRLYIPLVSFCDLTIMQLAKDSVHTQDFGEYGIGLTKNWGIRNKISPIVYVHENSLVSGQLHNLMRTFQKHNSEQDIPSQIISEAGKHLLDTFKFIKPYEGKLQRGKARKRKVAYYNEREWRFSPNIDEFPVYTERSNRKTKLTDLLNLKNHLLQGDLLGFRPADIRYLIIKNKMEIDNFIKIIFNNMDISDSEKNELATKIITWQEIKEDF